MTPIKIKSPTNLFGKFSFGTGLIFSIANPRVDNGEEDVGDDHADKDEERYEH